MPGLKRLISEVHRRSLWQVLAIYLVAAWIGYEVIQALTEGLGLPTWFPAFAIVLFIIGLPIVLATAVVQEGGPEVARHDPTLLPLGDEPAAQGPRVTGQPESGPSETGSERAAGLPRLLTWRNAIAGGVIAFALWGVVAAGWLLVAGVEPEPSGAKRIVVLPFENLGPPDDDYFADGITEEITARLAGVPGLGVIARTSALQYRATDKAVEQIGAELGVDHVLEGTVRWQRTTDGRSRIRVTPQLIRASDATHLWAEIYQEDMSDIFQVQASIAERVVEALGVALGEPVRQALETKPTENLEAYDYYLRGLDYQRLGFEKDDLEIAARMYERAIELDPGFAEAYAHLSVVDTWTYWFFYDRSEDRLAAAKAAADRALALEPDLPDAHAALGWYYYHGRLEYERALEHFATARASQPNNSQLALAIGAVHRRRGEWGEAAASFAQAVELDPRSATLAQEAANTYLMVREYAQAETYLERARSLAPDWAVPYSELAMLYLLRDGDVAAARELLLSAPADIAQMRNVAWLIRVLHPALTERIQRAELREYDDSVMYYLERAELYERMDRATLRHAYADSARLGLEARLRGRPDEAEWHAGLAYAYRLLGRDAEAIREVERAVELVPLSRDAFRGRYLLLSRAEIYAATGQTEKAIDELERLLSMPALVSAPVLQVDPIWDALRDHPRFQNLVRGR